jgi:hypothetical protein
MPTNSQKFAALDTFGSMRSSTEEEQELYANMLSRLGTPFETSIFDNKDSDEKSDTKQRTSPNC